MKYIQDFGLSTELRIYFINTIQTTISKFFKISDELYVSFVELSLDRPRFEDEPKYQLIFSFNSKDKEQYFKSGKKFTDDIDVSEFVKNIETYGYKYIENSIRDNGFRLSIAFIPNSDDLFFIESIKMESALKDTHLLKRYLIYGEIP